jgi:glutamyl-tRNA synthetase
MPLDPLPRDHGAAAAAGALRGRLAPSPTGALHLGNARTFLLGWLSIRAAGGSLVLRIEDLDGPRVKRGAEAQAIRDLEWLGLDWDSGPVRQTDRAAIYQESVAALTRRGLVYPCVCTRSEIESAASAPNLGDHETRYPGTCRGRYASREEAERASGRPAALRFVVSPGGVEFVDGFAGPQSFDPSLESGDFVIEKVERSGPRLGERTAAYQLACVVDDGAMGITDVLRGDDLLGSTARQILLQRAFGLPTPRYLHTPLMVGEDGRRLAKRHGDTTIARFRREGVPPEALIGWLAHGCGLAQAGSRLHASELVRNFSLGNLSPAPFTVTPSEIENLLSTGRR